MIQPDRTPIERLDSPTVIEAAQTQAAAKRRRIAVRIEANLAALVAADVDFTGIQLQTITLATTGENPDFYSH